MIFAKGRWKITSISLEEGKMRIIFLYFVLAWIIVLAVKYLTHELVFYFNVLLLLDLCEFIRIYFSFISKFVWNLLLGLKHRSHLDESGRIVKSINIVEPSSQFE